MAQRDRLGGAPEQTDAVLDRRASPARDGALANLVMEAELTLTRADLREGVLVVATGLVEVSKMPEFEAALAQAAGPDEELTIDLSDAAVASGAAVALLLNALRRVNATRPGLRVVCAPGRVRSALERAALTRWIDVVDELDEPPPSPAEPMVRFGPRAEARPSITCDPTPVRRSRLLADATVAIEVHYGDPDLSLEQVARRIATSSRQLQRVAELAGTTFRAELNAVRMQHAAELLQTSSLPVGAIARRVGHRQPAHFANAFRRHHGLSPTAFRRAVRAAPRATSNNGR
jgi:AraC family transcriptional regulator of adaptative response / methylphosphotriester-DNA alkyltransferase methyltransferase